MIVDYATLTQCPPSGYASETRMKKGVRTYNPARQTVGFPAAGDRTRRCAHLSSDIESPAHLPPRSQLGPCAISIPFSRARRHKRTRAKLRVVVLVKLYTVRPRWRMYQNKYPFALRRFHISRDARDVARLEDLGRAIVHHEQLVRVVHDHLSLSIFGQDHRRDPNARSPDTHMGYAGKRVSLDAFSQGRHENRWNWEEERGGTGGWECAPPEHQPSSFACQKRRRSDYARPRLSGGLPGHRDMGAGRP